MRTAVLRSAGVGLYGRRWQSEIARDLGVSVRTVARWLADEAMPDDVPDRLRPIVRARLEAIEAVRRLLWSDRKG